MTPRVVIVSLLLLCLALAPLNLLAQNQSDSEQPKYKVEQVNDREMVTSIIWAPDHRMFWTEKNGVVGTMSPDGVIQQDPVVEVTVWGVNEDGLLSVALDPDFTDNHYFYIFYTAPTAVDNPAIADLIVRYTYGEQNGIGAGTDPHRMLRIEIPTQDRNEHNGGRLKFGPDGFLYVSVGDMGDKSQAQDFNKIGGKIHRFTVSGDNLLPAAGNPFPGNSLWVSGVRNTFEFDFDSLNNAIFATENGPDCDDEINRIIRGKNYGWSGDVDCNTPISLRQAGGVKPMISWTPTIAPTGIILYSGTAFPGWQGQIFYCSWKKAELTRLHLTADHTAFTGDPSVVNLPQNEHCTIELAQSPEGYLYYSDVVGIYRIVPTDK